MYATAKEIEHATECGYTHDCNTHRGSRFERGGRRVWGVHDGWQTADIIDGLYTNHKKFTDLKEALNRA